jgi:hypothetical protein
LKRKKILLKMKHLHWPCPFDEDIQSSIPLVHQKGNMESYNPFENFDDALFHDCGNEESCQEDLDEVSLAEGLNETLLSTFPFEEDEVVQSCEEVINSYDTGEIMEQPPDIVDNHIDDFIQVGRHRWDFGHFIFYRDPIYDIEGSSQEKEVELSSSEDWSSCMYDSYVWQPSDDMVTYLFYPFEDDLSQHTQGDLWSSLDMYPFGDADLFYEDFHPLCSDFDRHQVMASPGHSEVHTTKHKYFHIETFGGDLQI